MQDINRIGRAFDRRQLWSCDHDYVLSEIEHSQRCIINSDAQVYNDVPECLAQDADGTSDKVRRDPFGFFWAKRAGKDHRPAGVVEDGAQQRFLERLRGRGRHAREATRRDQAGEQGCVAVREIQVD